MLIGDVTILRALDRHPAEVGIVGVDILRRLRGDRFLFRAGQRCLQSLRDRAGDFAFDAEDIFQLAIVALGPEVFIGRGLDQLHVDVHQLAGLLHAAFENIRDAELLRDFRQVSGLALILLSRGARNHLQRTDLRESGEDFVLNAGRKERVRFVLA